MTALRALGSLLRASVDTRTLTYRLLPYGEAGRTNVGKITASRGHLTIPDAATLVANLEHEPTRPVARFVSIDEDDTGLTATLRVLATSAGNDLLVEASEGVRTGISVEVSNPVIRAGALIGGALSGAGFVTTPAFPSAQLVAADAGDLPADAVTALTDALVSTLDIISSNVIPREPDQTDPNAPPAPTGDQTVTAALSTTATVQAGTLAARRGTTPKADEIGRGELFAMLASAHRSGGERGMLAALSDIVPGNIIGLEQPQYVGELWDGKAFERKIIPLFNHANLSSFTVRGWRWVTKPVVGAYAGNKGAVPSNAVSTQQLDISATRIAGAHDIDRKFRDFNDAEFFAAYFAAMTESYAKVSDATVLATISAAATDVVRGAVPAGVSPGMVSIIDGALSVLNQTDSMPTGAIVALDLWREIVLTRSEDSLAYLNAALNLEDGTIGSFSVVPSAALAAGSVLVAAHDAVTVHELGDVPIRVEAQNIANGGIDEGVFGYLATNVHDAGGLALVTAA
jgi:hypothetical protein